MNRLSLLELEAKLAVHADKNNKNEGQGKYWIDDFANQTKGKNLFDESTRLDTQTQAVGQGHLCK